LLGSTWAASGLRAGLGVGLWRPGEPGKFFLLFSFFFSFLVLFSGLYFLFNSGLHSPFVLQDFLNV
jgi:hypothetical protein